MTFRSIPVAEAEKVGKLIQTAASHRSKAEIALHQARDVLIANGVDPDRFGVETQAGAGRPVGTIVDGKTGESIQLPALESAPPAKKR